MVHVLRVLLAGLVDLLLPCRCAGCAAAPGPVCAACRAAVGGPAARRDPTPAPAGLPPVFAATSYAGPARRVVLAYKERAVRSLADGLATGLVASLTAALAVVPPGVPVLIVPVPSSAAARRRRGFDHTALLARLAARQLRHAGTGVSVCAALRHGRRVADQSGLGTQARQANLAGAFVVRGRALRRALQRAGHGAVAVVVDDVVTTGASLAEAARALRSAGLAVPAAAVVAATARTVGVAPKFPCSTGSDYADRPSPGGLREASVDTWRPPGSVVAPSPHRLG